MEQRSLFGLSEHLERLSKIGDPLEVLEATVDFEYFRGWLITQGRDVFEQAQEDPDSLADARSVQQAAEEGYDLECEDILHVVDAAYVDLTGENLPAGAYSVEYPDLGPDWDFDDDEEMAQHLPRLSELYLEG